MDINCCIAMTAAEFTAAKSLPARVGWLSCHFSQRTGGLSNLPVTLPENAVLIVDDSHPPAGHDPQCIADQLTEAVHRFNAAGVLLDFQVPGNTETALIARRLADTLPCPVCVATPYAADLSSPVLVSAPALHIPLQKHLAPWAGRQVWLEATLDAERITVTEQGSTVTPIPFTELPGSYFTEEQLFCHYQIREQEDRVEFTLVRNLDMLQKLLREAERQGVCQFIGLYQQLGPII